MRSSSASKLFTVAVVCLVFAALACEPGGADDHEGDPHGHDEGVDAATGPHDGRILVDGAFALELGIFERGVPPEYRAWATRDGRPLAPQELELRVDLARLGGVVDRIEFEPRGDHLVSTRPIAEPHSFEVSVEARYAGESHDWRFDSFEGRTRIIDAMAESLGVETSVAGPAVLRETITVYGRTGPNPERVRELRARFDGVVRRVHAGVGDRVRAGDVLLRVESNESLNTYAITAPIDGFVTQRDANPGEQTAGRLLLTVTDTSSVWVDLAVFPVDRAGVAAGSPVEISPALGGASVAGVVSWIGTEVDPHDQTVVARVELEDVGGELLPGTFVTGRLEVGRVDVPLAVERTAIQSFNGREVVFARFGDVYEVRMIDRGREAGGFVEVVGGIAAGTAYVTRNSHLLKADVEKAGAAHHH